jgi:predicted unusual protein kinase regulating ubiquinone biosynthesis (AarF/ABC1/UbiB family)
MSGMLPKGMDVALLLQEAKRQLQDEADYMKETEHLRRFDQLLADSPDFLVPRAYAQFSTPNILVMSFVDGVAVESLEHAPQAERDRIIMLLFGLFLREVFEFQCVQTDPDFANYRYQQGSGRMVLLDFGATRLYDRKFGLKPGSTPSLHMPLASHSAVGLPPLIREAHCSCLISPGPDQAVRYPMLP